MATRRTSDVLKGLLLVVLICGSFALIAARAQNTSAKIPAPTGKVTPWAAMKIANLKVAGRPLSANYTFEDGHWQYEVFIVKGKTLHEVEVDANTGKVLDAEIGNPKGEAKEMEKSLNKALGN